MQITVYAVAYNEEKIMPFFLDHYSQFVKKIVVYDNCSTDNTVNIVKNYTKCETEVITFNTDNSFDDIELVNIKSTCWKSDQSDYVITVDVDELLYHPNLIEFIEQTTYPLYLPYGYDMVSVSFPKSGIITSEIKTGVSQINYSKPCIFSPVKIKRCELLLGCHGGNFYDYNDNIVEPYRDQNLKLLHYKNISFDYRFEKNSMFGCRQSSSNIAIGSSTHFNFTREHQLNEFRKLLQECTEII
jgi:glycosyltransferase involved in cell wall biosynthesis